MSESNPPIWDLIPLSRFSAPAPTGTKALRLSLKDLWRRIWTKVRQPDEDEELPDADLRSAPDHLLDWVAPEPDWAAQGQPILADTLQSWLDAAPADAGTRTFVGAPISTIRPAIVAWAQEHDVFIVDPPTPKQILAADERWFEQWPLDPQVRLVFPGLERCFLRHQNGLQLFRSLLERLWETQPPVVALVDSWAWTYLHHAIHADAVFTYPQTLAPFDESRLDRWLRQISLRNGHRRVIFRLTSDGRAVLDTNGDPGDDTADNHKERISFLQELSMRSRGNPRVAWAMWRHSLRVAAEDELDVQVEENAEHDSGLTIWVYPWDDLALPEPSADMGKIESFVLHMLLIHGGMTDALLMQLLPFPSTDVLHGLHRLQRAELIQRGEYGWYVLPLGYPAVRAFLDQEGFPLDPL